ncbi:MAG: ASCH domain-containing protein [Planctomycetaceae bacterium]|nr:ASCH domain-containing protein [Planctomycetaceae bacterium]
MSTVELTCLSVTQPWASLLLSGEKWCENRSWMTDYRGPLWIHASEKIDHAGCEEWGIDPEELVTSAILGCVELVDVFHIDEFEVRLPPISENFDLDPNSGPAFIGSEICWIVVNPQPLVTPIPAKGKLRLWTFQAAEDDVREFRDPTFLIPDEYVPLNFLELDIDVNGTPEPIEFTFGDYVNVCFPNRDEESVIAFSDQPQYINGSLHYRAACEKAWELFPEDFDPEIPRPRFDE